MVRDAAIARGSFCTAVAAGSHQNNVVLRMHRGKAFVDQQVATHETVLLLSGYPSGYLSHPGSAWAAWDVVISDMNSFSLDDRSQPRTQPTVGDPVDRSAQQILEEELDAEETL